MALSYDLENDQIQLTYVDGDLQGKSRMVIVEKGFSGKVHSFADKQIGKTESSFGDAVTVTLNTTVDDGNRLFTLFLPKFAGAFRARPATTVALLTTNHGPVAAPALSSRSYQSLSLAGTVSTIDT